MQQRALDEPFMGPIDMINNNVEEAGTFEQQTMKKKKMTDDIST
jgi:hypothetical protein